MRIDSEAHKAHSPKARWEAWSFGRALFTVLWLVLTVGGGLMWMVMAGIGAGLSVTNTEIEGPIRFTLIGGGLGTAGLLGVWFLRRTRRWLVASTVFVLMSIVFALGYALTPK
jgi:hypothetical protein